MFDVSSPCPWDAPPKKRHGSGHRQTPSSPSIFCFFSPSSHGPGYASVPAFETNPSRQGSPIGPVFNAWPVPFLERPSETSISHSPPFLGHTLTNHDALVPLSGARAGQKIAVQKAPDPTASSVAQTAVGMCHRKQLWESEMFLSFSLQNLAATTQQYFLFRVAESSEQRHTSKTKGSPVPNTIP
jgi:hypothetical protein